MLNFKAKESEVKTGLDLSKAKVLMSNYGGAAVGEKLKPYQAVILEL